MREARCSCGGLRLTLSGVAPDVVACHCIECQRRTGSPFGAIAYYPADAVTISGVPKQYTRATATGRKFHNYFCPECGTSVYFKADNHPTKLGVALGAIADPNFPAPVRSVWEQSRHPWVEITAAQHFPRGKEG